MRLAAWSTNRSDRGLEDIREALGIDRWIVLGHSWGSCLADSPVPMRFIAAEDDIRPDWPLRQLAELVPDATFEQVPDVVHNFWSTDPDTWADVVSRACQAAKG